MSKGTGDHEIESGGDEDYLEYHCECRAGRSEKHHADYDGGEADHDPAAALDRSEVDGKPSSSRP